MNLVIDFGISNWKVGFSSEINPRFLLSAPAPINFDFQSGAEADKSQWREIFKFMKQDPKETVVSWTHPAGVRQLTKNLLETAAQYLMEDLEIPAFQSIERPITCLLYNSLPTGVSVHLGSRYQISLVFSNYMCGYSET